LTGVKNILVDAVFKGGATPRPNPVAEAKTDEKKPNSSAKAAGPATTPIREIPQRKPSNKVN
jgi:hypothetical protein